MKKNNFIMYIFNYFGSKYFQNRLEVLIMAKKNKEKKNNNQNNNGNNNNNSNSNN